MIAHKHITKIIAAVMALAVCLCFGAVIFSEEIAEAAGDTGVNMEYESKLFDTDQIISVNILMNEDDWQDMLDNAMDEEYHKCDVEINGTTIYNVGIRTKGNTSLSSIANDPTTDRYSFKLEFDHYVDGQTCFGLDKLVLNNNYADATNMKEALVYDMFAFMDADASLYNYASISLNGEYWGVYLALESVEESFVLRNYGTQNGQLYKPEGMNVGGGGQGGGPGGDLQPDDDFDPGDFDPADLPENFENGNMAPPDLNDNSGDNSAGDQENGSQTQAEGDNAGRPQMPENDGGQRGGFSMGGSGGADLNYTDDDLDSYSTIWEGEITDTGKKDRKRVVKALKNISEGTDLEEYMDIDNLLRYMAVHLFSVNDDSLSGSMAHNYYLYEYNGMLNLIPWDYNLSFGGMNGGSSASSVVNSPIDDAFSSTDFFDTLMADEEYHSLYYTYMAQLVDEYVNGGGFDSFYQRARGQIDALAESDPNALYTYDEYLEAVDTLYQVVKLRAQSISLQLDGTIPSSQAERQSSDTLVDASGIDISVMGTMNAGGGMGGGRPNRQNDDESTNTSADTAPESGTQQAEAEPIADTIQGTQDMPSPPQGSTDDSDRPAPPDGQTSLPGSGNMTPPQDGTQTPPDVPASDSDTRDGQTDAMTPPEKPSGDNSQGADGDAGTDDTRGDLPQMGGRPGESDGSTSESSSARRSNLIFYGVSAAVIAAAMIFVLAYRRRR